MSALLFILAAFLLLGLLGVSLSLVELDRRLSELSQAMEERYGRWMQQAEDRKRAKDVKNGRNESAENPAGQLRK